jgi:hypothetical protein
MISPRQCGDKMVRQQQLLAHYFDTELMASLLKTTSLTLMRSTRNLQD